MNARELALQPLDSILSLPDSVTIVYEDGLEVQSAKKKVIYSWYFWEFHRRYPDTPLLSRHHVDFILKGKSLSMDTHIRLLEVIFADCVATYGFNNPQSKEPLWKLIYEITNRVYNEVAQLAEEYVSSIDILDFIEVMDYPPIKEAVDSTEPNNNSISNMYAKVLKHINNDDNLKFNALARAVRTGMVNSNQLLQCITVRGFVAEVDGSILSTPIMTNYAKGMNQLYDYIADSRSAARSLYFSEAPLQDAEYFARRLQLLCMTVERIAYEDCGSSDYVEWLIRGPQHNEFGHMTYPGDLPFMMGKHYVENGVMLTIDHDDPQLYGRVIHLRSVLTCKHKDQHAVCVVCFGELAHNVSKYANTGHICAATMTQQTSQSVLSTKHLLASAVSTAVQLNDVSRKFFYTNKEKNGYILHEKLKKQQLRMIVNREEAAGLIDILNVKDISNISPSRISYVDKVEIAYVENKAELYIPITVSQDNRRAIITIELLIYLRNSGWETDNKGNFVFDMTHWDFSKPVLKLPDMEYSYSDHSAQIGKLIEANIKNMQHRSKAGSPKLLLEELFTLVNSKLNVSMSALEVIIYSVMLPELDNYNLSRGRPDAILGVADLVIKNRSMGASLPYEDQAVQICNPRSFFKLNRPDSVFDAMIAPGEVVQHYKGRDK